MSGTTRSGPLPRAMAKLWAWRLDWRLLEGADPQSSRLLAARAEQLTTPEYREELASRLGETLTAERRPIWILSSALKPSLELEAAKPVLIRALTILQSPEPVHAQGVAKLRLLLNDGGSPLFFPKRTGELTETAEEIVKGLQGRLPS